MSPLRRLGALALLLAAFAAGRATAPAPASPPTAPSPTATPRSPMPPRHQPPPAAEAPPPSSPAPPPPADRWEEVPGPEQPAPWRAALAAALADCPNAASLVSTNCDEYPCVAVLRAPGLVSSAETVQAALERCPSFAALQAQTPTLLTIDTDQRCPDGSTAPVIILTAVQDETAKRLSEADSRPVQGLFLTGVAFGRRVEGALASLPCPDEP